ncbi:S-phase kinase-associated protein 1-like [Malaya genurostris]|uniref:S-phase kinase-associated protein 1-like n=1 Tax=Malaya genurostris TaxID=325434 RepID=UPI0026F389A6|nr:S-phase kinase-associated protein 1-like [Malaya genurostris]
MSTIKLQTSDEIEFVLDSQLVRHFGTISTMLEDAGIKLTDGEVIPLPNVNSAIFRKLLEWVEHHKHDHCGPSAAEELNQRADDISRWDRAFLNVDQRTLFQIMLAANYLDMKALVAVTCKTVANMIEGKTVEQIRSTFHIKNDFPPGEEKKIRAKMELWEERT